jgi:predicted GH43/DUF377 family glycosyl hydrolase
MSKTKKRKRRLLFPCAVTTHNSHVLFLYVVQNENESNLVLSRSDNGLDFTKENRFINIISEKGKKEKLSGCKSFDLCSFDGAYYLIYTREFKKFLRRRIETIIARSDDLENFKIIDRVPDNPLEVLTIVSNHKHKKNILAYHANKSIYVSASEDLVNWHTSGKLLSPRKDCFDSNSLQIIDTLVTSKGILVLYESSKIIKGLHELKVGAALFSLSQPYKIIWRSSDAIWGKIIDKKDYPLRPIGAVLFKNFLRIYWANRKEELFSVNTNLVYIGLDSLSKSSIQLKKHVKNPIIKPNAINVWESDATFNPAALNIKDKIHLLYRAIGNSGLSVFGYASSEDGFLISERLNDPAYVAPKIPDVSKKILPTHSLYVSGDSWAGCEDPRLTQIGDRIYMTYVSFDGYHSPGVALTSINTNDFLDKNWKWRKPILISKPGEIQKNWVLFPEKINGKYAILHSITPNISIEYVDDLDKEDLIIESNKRPGKDEYRWDNIVRGAGAPPLRTKYGWLVLYHAMDKRDPNKYKVGAMILDNDDPTKILYRSQNPILEPSFDYENNGAKAGVVYVCGAVIKDDTLFVYYGG